MVLIAAGIYEGTLLHCSGVSDSVLCLPIVYAEASTGQTPGSMAYYAGEFHRTDGIHPAIISDKAAGFLQNYDFYLLLCECVL